MAASRLTEEFKCSKVWAELLLSGIKDVVVRNVIPNPTKGNNWNPRMAVQKAEAALRHAEIVGDIQFGRGGLGAWHRKTGVDQSRSQS